MVSEGNEGESVLKFLWIHYRNLKVTSFSSIMVYDRLKLSEYFILSNIELLMLLPDWIFLYDPVNAEFPFLALAFRPTGALLILTRWTNWFFLEGIIKVYPRVSGRKRFNPGENFWCDIFFDSRTRSVQRTINNSQADVGVDANYVKNRLGSN